MDTLTLTIDGQPVECSPGMTVLAAADAAGVYIPRMCHHPDLAPANELTWAKAVYQVENKITGEKPEVNAGEEAHCNLCLVEVEGQSQPVNSCITPVEDGLIVHINTEEVSRRRKQALSRILSDHPHACLTCAQKKGCSRTDCSSNVPVDERCCVLLGHCELEKVSDFIGISGDTPRYVPRNRGQTTNDPLFDRDYNLCIGCLRCVRVCQKVQGIDVIGAVWKENRAWIGTLAGAGLIDSQCRFCSACVEICPTGALLDKEGAQPVRCDTPLPCTANCPAGIDIPAYVGAIAAGHYQEALDIIKNRVPFPSILGYTCFHPCEDACRRTDVDDPVAICDLKRFVADTVVDEHSRSIEKRPDTGKKVAIIGSGPAGCTAAYYLCTAGHNVGLFDRESKPGGMLRHGIPDYRLPPEVLDREIESLKSMGISFHMGHRFDSEDWLEDLKSDGYDAVLIATGASASKALPIENSDLDGIYPGLEFLKSAKLSGKPHLDGRAVVIGGGNVAIDAAMTAVRLGAGSVSLVCLESRDKMPAHDWEITQAEDEGVEILPSWGPKRFSAGNGQVSGVEFMKCTSVFDEQGRFAPQYDENEIKNVPADSVIIAIGQQVEPELLQCVKKTSEKTNKSPMLIEGVFAAGDVSRGPSSVVDAIADGRRVADAIDKYLGGNGIDDDVHPTLAGKQFPEADISGDLFQQPRQSGRLADPDTRKSGFGLINQTFTEQEAKTEAQRCLRCYLRQRITPVFLPPERWQPLNSEAVDSVPNTEGVIQFLNEEKKVIGIAGTPDMRQSLKERLENPGNTVWFIWEEDPMYTKRESELIQSYLQEHGQLPGSGGGDDDLDDLF
jgi:formate dehydrogenase beta subunit